MSSILTAMDKFIGQEKTDPRDFFIAWQVPCAVIAERLRKAGFPATSQEISNIMQAGITSKEDRYKLSIVMMEIRNDITKTLYTE